jgi:hypothetical protein
MLADFLAGQLASLAVLFCSGVQRKTYGSGHRLEANHN